MTSPVIALRAGLPRDREIAVDLLEILFGVEADVVGGHGGRRQAAQAHYEALLWRIAHCDGRLILAEADGIAAGLISLVIEQDMAAADGQPPLCGVVADLVVRDEHRRRGIARMLLQEAERLTRERGLRRLVVSVLVGNEAAGRAYRAFGFEPNLTVLVKPVMG